MSAPKAERNRHVRERRATDISLRAVAREFGISLATIVRILDETGGDPQHLGHLSSESAATLEHRRKRLVQRIGEDLRDLVLVNDEIAVRAIDKILGLTK